MALTQVSSKGIKDATLLNEDVNASAAIAKSKIENFVNNNADNRVITGSGTGNTLNAESGVVIDSSGRLLVGTTTDNGFKFKVSDSGGFEFAFAPNDSGVNNLVNYNRSGNAYVPFQVSGLDLRFGSGGNTERMRLDSSGRLLLGTTTEGHSNADNLTVASSGETGITIRSGTSNQASLYFSDATSGTGEYAGSVVYNHSDNKLFLATSSSNRLTIDSSGNVGIGRTDPPNKLRVEDSASGVIVAKQTTNNGGFNTFEGKSSSGTTTFYASHNGRVGASEGIIFGSDTASGNVLDDYEEGTFTPTFMASGTESSGVNYGSRAGTYTKIGRKVTVNLMFELNNNGSTNGQVEFGGLPFTTADLLSNTTHEANGSVGYMINMSSSVYFLTVSAAHNGTKLFLLGQLSNDTGFDHIQKNQTGNNFSIRCSCTYFTS